MTLWWFELKKSLFTGKGLLIFIACLMFKILLLLIVPEMKDERILLSQKQYDKYLEQLYGENTPEKTTFIKTEYDACLETIGKNEVVKKEYQEGTISEEEWQQYSEVLDQAYLHQNALSIFAEKEMQFETQSTEILPANYIYEYGWQTVFTLQLFPDVFLLIAVLLLSTQCFSTEAASGMLPVLLATRDGRQHLFGAKVWSLMVICLSGALISILLEVVIFWLRGWCNDGNVPIYSISLFAEECPLEISLWQGYILSLFVRLCVTLLLAILFFGVSVWISNITNLIFAAVCILVVPLLLIRVGGRGVLFTHAALLCGSRMLMLVGKSRIPIFLEMGVVAAYSLGILYLAKRRYQRGL